MATTADNKLEGTALPLLRAVSDAFGDIGGHALSAPAADDDTRPMKIRRINEVSIESCDSTQQGDVKDEWDSDVSLEEDVDGQSQSDMDSLVSDVDDQEGDGEEESLHDDGFSDDELPDESEIEMYAETLTRVKNNDPEVTMLSIYGFSDLDIDGYEAGLSVGENTRLKKLTVRGLSMEWEGECAPKTREDFLEFAVGVTENRSLEHMSLSECSLGSLGNETAVAAITTLSPLIRLNNNLRSLYMVGCDMGDEAVRTLSSALRSRRQKGSFQRIRMDANKISDAAGRDLVEALLDYDNLEELSMGDNEIGGECCTQLKKLLSRPDSKMRELNLENNNLDDYGITSLSAALKVNTTLKELNLSFNCEITQAGWGAFSSCLRRTGSGLELLNLSSTNIGNWGLTSLGEALCHNSTLKTLDLYDLNWDGVPLVDADGWRAFFSCLRSPSVSALGRIDLRYSSIDVGGLSALAEALDGNSTVKMLDLSHNDEVDEAGWKSFFSDLKTCNFGFEKLLLSGNNITDEVLGDLAGALAGNTTVETLVLGDLVPVTDAGWEHFRRLLCDTSSAATIHSSNHTLRHVGQDEIPSDIHSLLQLNQSGTREEVAREKILRHRFQGGKTTTPDFLEMDLKVMPQAISWGGRDGAGQTLIYELLRSQPSLLACDTNGGKACGSKRKWDSQEI